MKITHHGHACVQIEKRGTRILIDPGIYAFEMTGGKPEDFTGLAALLLTHEHRDHYTPDILQTMVKNNPDVVLYTNASIQKLLADEGIEAKALSAGESAEVGSMKLTAWDCPHEKLPFPAPESIGFMIDDRVLHVSDSLLPNPVPQDLEVLLAPAQAPWMGIMEALDFVERVKPKIVMPIHTAVWRKADLLDLLYVNVLRDRGYRVEKELIEL